MFKRKRSQRVHPDELVQEAYIKRRYEDLSVSIHKDIKNGRGRYNYYAPWLEMKLKSFPTHYKEKHSVLHTQPVELCVPETSQSTTNVFTKSMISPASVSATTELSLGISPKSAWTNDQDQGAPSGPSMSTDIYTNRTLPFDDASVASPTINHREDVNYANIQGEEDNAELGAKRERHSTVTISQHVSFSETTMAKEGKEVASAIGVSDLKRGDEDQGEETVHQTSSSFIRRHGSSTSSKICTII